MVVTSVEGAPAFALPVAAPPSSPLARLSDELQAMASLLRMAADPQDPAARRRVRATLETALLLRPLLARKGDDVILERLQQQVNTAQALIDWRARKPAGEEPPLSLTQVLPLLLPLLERKPAGGTAGGSASTAGGTPGSVPATVGATTPASSEGAGGILSRLLPAVTNPTTLANLAGLVASLNALRAHSAPPPAAGGEAGTSLLPPTSSSSFSSSSASTPGSQPDGGQLPAALNQLVPAAAALLNNPAGWQQILTQAEQRLGRERLEHLYQLAQRLAAGVDPAAPTTTATGAAAS
ncbi:MAG: hypothetical protein IMX01_02515 [Limnochordaceae bacterium]|nr:hypothetical protein [Limnochordaceae bacterium]